MWFYQEKVSTSMQRQMIHPLKRGTSYFEGFLFNKSRSTGRIVACKLAIILSWRSIQRQIKKFFSSLKSTFGLIKSETSFMFTFSFRGLSSRIYAQKALKRHFIMVQGYSALRNLIYALLPRGRRVEALKESRAQCEHTECIYSGIDGRWDEVWF